MRCFVSDCTRDANVWIGVMERADGGRRRLLKTRARNFAARLPRSLAYSLAGRREAVCRTRDPGGSNILELLRSAASTDAWDLAHVCRRQRFPVDADQSSARPKVLERAVFVFKFGPVRGTDWSGESYSRWDSVWSTMLGLFSRPEIGWISAPRLGFHLSQDRVRIG